MASSFGEAFAKSFQAEMARRKDAEAEIAREQRLEERAGRERALRIAEGIERDDAQEAKQIERELRFEKRQEAERQRVEDDARWLAASRTDPSIAADFSADWRDDQRKIAAMEALDVRAEKAGVGRFGGDTFYQPAGREGGRPVTEATPEYIAGLETAEERQKALRAAAHVREAEESRLGAGRAVRENAAFDRAVAEFGISEASKKEGSWDNFYEKRDASQKLSQSEEASNYSAQYSKMSDLYMALPPYQRVGIDTKDGILTRKGVSQLLQFGGYEQVERKDPETGDVKWVKVARFARPDIKPLTGQGAGEAIPSSPYDVQPEPAPQRGQGVMTRRLLAEAANRQNAATPSQEPAPWWNPLGRKVDAGDWWNPLGMPGTAWGSEEKAEKPQPQPAPMSPFRNPYGF